MHEIVRSYFDDGKISYWARSRRDYNDPLQKALEDVMAMVELDQICHKYFEEDLMKGFLIISEYPRKYKTVIYKLSDLGIQLIKFEMI